MAIIEATGLTKRYKTKSGPVDALSGLDLSVDEGKVKALLGPNGAGKTTAVKVLTTLIRPTAGSASVAGIDVMRDPEAVRRIIGASGQYSAVDENLTGFENLEMVGRLYHLGKRQSRRRAHELIELFDLEKAANRPVKGFSGGMRRRIDLAGALVIHPKVLFLDEPTTGLDPRSRLALWDIINELVLSGTSLLLTTQYLEEADRLADDIAVIDGGAVIAEGTSDQLKARVGGHRIEISLVDASDFDEARRILGEIGDAEPTASDDHLHLEVAISTGPQALQSALGALGARQIELHDAGMRRPTLDDVFLRLTGHAAEKETTEQEDDNDPAKTEGAHA